jgi:nitrite reductase (NO-forming)
VRKFVNSALTIILLLGIAGVYLNNLSATVKSPGKSLAQEQPTVEYTLTSVIGKDPPMAFLGVGGSIDGIINPQLTAQPGDIVRINFINADPIVHDLTIDEFQVSTGPVQGAGEKGTITFKADKAGVFAYYCNTVGHRAAGMEGRIVIGEVTATAAATGVSIVKNPTDLPPPIGDRAPTNVRIDLVAKEVVGQLADGATYNYFTFNGTVPGPFLRVRVGDTVELHLKNETGDQFLHSIDLHAVTGPGGGAVYTQTNPGEETMFTFKALIPGLFVYHCATPSIAHHISSGMYGMILVEPPGGLPKVDHEFYVMEGEIYTKQPFGSQGLLDFDEAKMMNELPEYYVFNGAANALTTDANALRAKVGETVRIFFGVGGPNKISSFHVIGEIMDRVYDQASLTSPPLTDVQTTLVPPGGATVVEFKLDVPGRYLLVDHSLSRLERGLVGFLYAEGPDAPDIFHGETITPGSGH